MAYGSSGGGPTWQKRLGSVRSFIGTTMGGVRGGTNLAAWLVAGTMAYYLWIKPSQQLKIDQKEAGLANGNKNRGFKSEE